MKAKKAFYLLVLLAAISGCRKGEQSGVSKVDPCLLLTSKEIETVQGSPIKETKGTEHSEAGLRVSQCYFGVEPSSKSVSLAVTQADPADPAKRAPKDYWEETFVRHAANRKSDSSSEEKESESAAPTKVEGVGADAYWIGNPVGGALYVIRNNIFVRISLGGPDDQKTKIDHSKALAQKALNRLQLNTP